MLGILANSYAVQVARSIKTNFTACSLCSARRIYLLHFRVFLNTFPPDNDLVTNAVSLIADYDALRAMLEVL